jgi:hypothetical protein
MIFFYARKKDKKKGKKGKRKVKRGSSSDSVDEKNLESLSLRISGINHLIVIAGSGLSPIRQLALATPFEAQALSCLVLTSFLPHYPSACDRL